jgi:ATP-dependent Lhr-like helicase
MILKSNILYDELDESSQSAIDELRSDFKGFVINDYSFDCPIIKKGNKLILYTFTGTKINKSLSFLFSSIDVESSLIDSECHFELNLERREIAPLIKKINEKFSQINTILKMKLSENDALIGFSKWGEYLPLEYQVEIVKERFFDFEGAIDLINNMNLIEAK